MTIDTVNNLIDALHSERLLDAEQIAQLTPALLNGHKRPLELAHHLVRAGWLTEYQVRHLFDGRSTRLVLGNYCIVDRLGEGGVSEVYKAWDRVKRRHVVVKVMRQDLASKADAIRQFERELQAVTRLNHHNIIRTHDAACAGNSHYFTMEHVDGTDLGKVVQHSGALPIAEACDYVRQVAAGLQYAHTMGLVHRDIKPANLFLIIPPGHDSPAPGVSWKRPADPVIKILDWGLARLQSPQGEGDPFASCSVNREEGMLIGTADYIAPEQARDPRLVDIRADIYSLGCTFYYLLTGQPPFPGTSLMQKLLQHQEEEPAAIQTLRPEVPEELAAIVRKMLAKQPEQRFQIPLGISVPLRRFCGEGTASHNGRRAGTQHISTPRVTAQGNELRPAAPAAATPVATVGGFLRRR